MEIQDHGLADEEFVREGISELSRTDKRAYDILVEKVNARAGVEMILPANKRERIEQLQATIGQFGG